MNLVGVATIDLDNHTAFHIEAPQTKVDKNTEGNLTAFYAKVLKDRSEKIKKISKHLAAGTWFSKRPFVKEVLEMDLHIVSRLRDDADLKYLYKPQKNDNGKKLKAVPKNMMAKLTIKTRT